MSSIFACDLGLNGKTMPVIFSVVLFFVFEKISWTSPGGKCTLCWFYFLEKQKLSLERTPPGKKLRFAYVICGKWKRNQQTKIGGCVFLWSGRPHAKIELIWTRKKFGLKSHLHGFCRHPFNSCTPLIQHTISIKSVGALSPNYGCIAEAFFWKSPSPLRHFISHCCDFNTL